MQAPNLYSRADQEHTEPIRNTGTLCRLSWIVPVLAVMKLGATVLLAERYGFHRDEFYYLAAARHLAFGYVDFPPIAPFLARLDTLVFGTSLTGLRLVPALAGALVVLLTGLMARELGGSSRVQGLATMAVALSPVYLGGNFLFQTVTFDQFAWAAVLFLVLRLLRTGNPWLWLPIGVAMGIGLMTKYTILALALGLTVGLLLTSTRVQLRTSWPWLAALIAIVLMTPNLVWQLQHRWIGLDYVLHHQGQIGDDTSPLTFVLQQVLLVGPIGVPLALAGFYTLFLDRRHRLLGWTCLVVEVGLLAAGGKAYYAGPVSPLLIAAGSVQFVNISWKRQMRRAGVVIAGVLVAANLALVPLSLPVLPVRAMAQSGIGTARPDFAEMIGWRDMVLSVARVYRALPQAQRSTAVILAENDGEAGAIDTFGPHLGLPDALSGHLTYYYWKPPHVAANTVIAVGFPRSVLTRLFGRVVVAGTIHNTYRVRNIEYGREIYVCDQPRTSLDRAWPTLQHSD